jgi:eukaryotic-like serine/threonine-protein kinase
MSPKASKRISDVYHAALDRAPAERRGFLEQACGGDETLRREVESLLRYEPASARFLETPAAIIAAANATSLIGSQLGPYRIVASLPPGGMADVFRARDSKLPRDVVVKILPAEYAADPERRARFAREARLLATLNHPNIATLYGLEEADGMMALILELIDGPSLAARLERGPLPLPVAVSIARQIADALAAAHARGIVHRDLKPNNVALQIDGSGGIRAKVLDFGLAKTMAASGLSSQAEGAPSRTADGRILGTPAYMSPEQARGLPVDTRTDIWSFGCVLYEMLTGRSAFDGATASDTMANVLDRDPDWTALPPSTPPQIRKLLERCLTKDEDRRVQDIADASSALDPSFGGGRRIRDRFGGILARLVRRLR